MPRKRKVNQNTSEDDGTKNKNRRRKKIVFTVFAIIEVLSLILWQQADEFSGFSSNFIHLLSKCGFLAGGAYLAHEFSKELRWRISAWVAWLALCVLMFVVTIRQHEEPKPNLELGLITSHLPSYVLVFTNKELFVSNTGKITWEQNISPDLIIPISENEKGLGLEFLIANRSPVEVKNPEVFFRYPDDVKFDFAPGWNEPMGSPTGDIDEIKGSKTISLPPVKFREFVWESQKTLRPQSDTISGDSEPLPTVSFLGMPYNALSGYGTEVAVTLRAENVNPISIRFFLFIEKYKADFQPPLPPLIISSPKRYLKTNNGIVVLDFPVPPN